MNIDTDTIDRIVTGVLDQLAGGGDGASGELTAETPRRGNAEVMTIKANVVTAEVLLTQANGASQVVVSQRAIVTPAAWDAAKERSVQIVRSSDVGQTGSSGASAVHQSAAPAITSPLMIVIRNTDALERLWADISSTWRRELFDHPDDAAALAVSAVCRGETSTVVILAEQAHRAACLANRNERVNAVALSDAGDVPTIKGQLRANVWCLNPTGRSWFELRTIFRTITNN